MQDYIGAGRYRTALDELLEILARKPGDQEALYYAALVLSVGRTDELTAAEPWSRRYTFDRRLDPIFVVCCGCESREWVPNAVHLGLGLGLGLAGPKHVTLMNPMGLQCQRCGYTLCRDCLEERKIGVGLAVYEHRCPHCPTEELSAPVVPTGRPPAQFAVRLQRITAVVLFREGPVIPDRDYVLAFFEARSPDVLAGNPQIYPVAAGAWPEDLNTYTLPYLYGMSLNGSFDTRAIKTAETGTVVDDYGARVHVVKLYETGLAEH
jgi:hypothetical protein